MPRDFAEGAPRLARLVVAERELTRDDLSRLDSTPRQPMGVVAKIRESHRHVARLVAVGKTNRDIAELTGYTTAMVKNLKASPAFQELVAIYREKIDASFFEEVDEYHRLATQNMIAAERHIADQIEDHDERGELLPIGTALRISRDAADRFGYGKRQTNTNINIDFASKLESMIARSSKVIDGASTTTSRGPGSTRALPASPMTASQSLPLEGNPAPTHTEPAAAEGAPGPGPIRRRLAS